MLHLVLCDDDPRHNQTLRTHLNQILPKLPTEAEIVLETTKAQDVIAYAEAPHQQTIFLLDLVLDKGQSGLDVCRAIYASDKKALIIYVSAFAEYALECLETHAFDLIVKPYSPERLENALRDAIRFLAYQKEAIPLEVTTGSITRIIDQKSIRYFKTQREYVTAYLDKGQFTWRESLTKLMERINQDWFIRIHKNCAFNRLYFESLNKQTRELTLTDGTILPVSRRCLNTFGEALLGKGESDTGS